VAYPNPFATSTRIGFDIEQSDRVRLVVLGADLSTVMALLDDTLPAGRHTYTWDGHDEQERRLPPGPYWIVLRVGDDYSYRLAIVADTDRLAQAIDSP
jgi:hypothetical protein